MAKIPRTRFLHLLMLIRNGPVVKSVESSHEAGRESVVGKICERGKS